MLILIVGVSGNIGNKLLDSLIRRGHSVRGLGRDPSKVTTERMKLLESFHTFKNWYDEPKIRNAIRGVDAVVCAYGPNPVLLLEGQLLLVRIMEELGVTRFFPSTWNLDWSKNTFGDVPYYDLWLGFERQLSLTSTIKPFYIFIGILSEVFFSLPGHGQFAPEHHGVWDPKHKSAEVWGTGNEKWPLTTEQDCAEFTAALVTDMAQTGGYYRFCSGHYSIMEIATIYEAVKGVQVQLEYKGSLGDLADATAASRASTAPDKYYEWMGYCYQLQTLDGTYYMADLDNGKYPEVKTTSLERFFEMDERV